MNETNKAIAESLRNLRDNTGSKLDKKLRDEANRLDPPKVFKVGEFVRDEYTGLVWEILRKKEPHKYEVSNGLGARTRLYDTHITHWLPEKGEEVWSKYWKKIGVVIEVYEDGGYEVEFRNGDSYFHSLDNIIPASFAPPQFKPLDACMIAMRNGKLSYPSTGVECFYRGNDNLRVVTDEEIYDYFTCYSPSRLAKIIREWAMLKYGEK